jgi:hypothetical protein
MDPDQEGTKAMMEVRNRDGGISGKDAGHSQKDGG